MLAGVHRNTMAKLITVAEIDLTDAVDVFEFIRSVHFLGVNAQPESREFQIHPN